MSTAVDDRKRGLSFSSQNVVVQRWFGGEILDHSPKSVRMDFMASGNAPLLMHHDMRQQVGVIDSASIKNGVGRAVARFGRTGAATDALANVDDGIYRNTSVGYRVHEMVLESSKNGEDVYRITDWEPYEASLVGVPADSTVGVGRHISDTHESIVSTHSAQAATRSIDMSTETAAAGASAGTQNGAAAAAAAATGADATRATDSRITVDHGPTAFEIEQQRVRAIDNMCKANNFDDAMRQRWVSSGMPFDKVSDEMMRIMSERGKQNERRVATNLDLSTNDVKKFSIVRAIRAVSEKDWSKAGFEMECSREISNRLSKNPDPMKFYVPYDVQARSLPLEALTSQQRALNLAGARPFTRADTVGSTATGGFLVQTTNLGFIEFLRNRSVAFRMGATQLSGLVGNVNVPRQTAAATAYWLASETTQITESDQTFGQMPLTPHTVGGYTEISRLLLLQSSPDIEGIVNADLAAICALAVDKGAISGSGTSGQPLGIVGTSGVGTASSGDMSTIAYKGELDFQVAVANANVVPVRGGYVATPTVAALLMQRNRFANTMSPLWDGNLWDANGPLGVAGFPGMSSLQIPASGMIFGDWEKLVIAEWGVLEIEVNPYANFQAGIIGVRAIVTIDVGLRYPAAFCINGANIT